MVSADPQVQTNCVYRAASEGTLTRRIHAIGATLVPWQMGMSATKRINDMAAIGRWSRLSSLVMQRWEPHQLQGTRLATQWAQLRMNWRALLATLSDFVKLVRRARGCKVHLFWYRWVFVGFGAMRSFGFRV